MHTTIAIDEQIALTLFSPADKANLVRFLNDPVIGANTLSVPHPYTDQHASDWLALVEANRATFGIESKWAIRHPTAGVIGGIGRFVKTGTNGHSDEIGYWLAAPYRGQSLMSKVVAIYTDWLFAHTPLVRIEAYVFPHNPASVRVLEKAGFEREGYLRFNRLKNGRYFDSILMVRIKPGFTG